MKKIVFTIILVVVIALAVLLLGSMLTAYLRPDNLHVFAFAGFVFPVFWLLNLLILIWLGFHRNWLLVIPLLSLIVSWEHWGNTFQIKGRDVPNTEDLVRPVSVMSYNTRMFDFYNHSGKTGSPGEIFNFVLRQNPDIICFQEYFTSLRREEYTPTSILAQFRRYNHRYIEYLRTHSGDTGYGLAIFSKYPIVDQGVMRFENSLNMAMYADINVDGKIVRVFNNHLESIGFKDDDLNVLDSLDFRMSNTQRQGLRNISRKLNRAFSMRADQAEFLARHIEHSVHPVIVCGDFNDIPVSYVYRTMRGDLKDAFRESGSGFGGTYNGNLPSFRIDYIFHDAEFESYNFKTFPFDYSDHFPIMTTIDLK